MYESKESCDLDCVIFCYFLIWEGTFDNNQTCFNPVGVSTSAGRMGQRNTRLESKPKPESNPDYQTYGREGDVDYAVDQNFDLYQPSDYDEMYDTSRENSCKVRLFCIIMYFTENCEIRS